MGHAAAGDADDRDAGFCRPLLQVQAERRRFHEAVHIRYFDNAGPVEEGAVGVVAAGERACMGGGRLGPAFRAAGA
ncbi:hypothetical protein LZK73_20180 [Neorhizobium galegae]|nr:hypothetical protein LZK73_20180 [Neorhizobium galegae]